MTDAPVPTRAEIVEALRSSADELLAAVATVPVERLEEGRYEGGWNARQILAHVAAIEWTYPRLLEVPSQAPTDSTKAGALPTRTARGGIDAYNARQVAKRADVPAADLLAEFRRNREATIAAVASADEALLAAPIRSAGGVTGPLGGVIMSVAVGHVRAHAKDIAG